MSGAATDIAVIGMSCRFPGVHDPDGFWRLLREGKSTIGTFSAQRSADANSRYAGHPDAATLGSGSFFDSVDGFDAGFFGIGAAEAAAMDPVQRLGLELAWEAVENARIAADTLAGREVDVVVGASASGYDLLRKLSGSDQDDHYAVLGSSGALIANRISNLLDVRGMSFSADSGQSSSLVSLALTCERIRSGAVDLALAGGVQLVVDPEAGAGLANLGALSPDGRCYPFDARANGFTRGEGGAFVLLKRADLALADGDHIHALIRGWGVASAGASARMPDPSPTGQAAAVRSALERAGVDFDDVDYVEAHGTGTRLGDPAELSGLRQVSGSSGRTRPLAVGSVKANVGHLEPAAGIVGFVKAALCVEHGHLVPTPGFTTANPAVEDFHRDFEVLRATRPWPGTAQRPRRAGVSSIGMGGTNAHVILEQAPTPYEATHAAAPYEAPHNAPNDGTEQPGTPTAWALSARSEGALRAQAARLRDRVAADGSLSRADVALSLVSTRTLFEHRAVVLADDREEALAGLTDLAAGDSGARVIRGTATGPAGPVVLVFPGQGSQWAGMGRQLYAQSEVFARSIDACSRALEPWQDWSLVDLVTGAASAPSLEDGDSVVQPALFSMMVSLAHLWRSFGVVPDAVVGHSQGEIAAACAAGALSLEDAARVVALRSQALAPLVGRGGMSAVAASQHWVEQRLSRWAGRLSVAVANGPASVVISGDPQALDEFETAAHGAGIRARRLKVDYASHSHHVELVRDQVLKAAEGISPRTAEVEFHSTVTTGLLDTSALDASYWYANLRSTVRFGEVIENLMRERGGVYVEVSPHPVLQIGMEEAADALPSPPTVVSTLNRQDGGLGTVLRSLGSLHVRGVPVDWDAANTATAPNTARRRRIALPTYPFQHRRHWLTASASSDAAHDTAGQPDTAGVRAVDLDSAQAVRALVCTETAALLATRGAALSGAQIQSRAAETFKSLGFDSSMAIDLRNRLGEAAAQRLPATVAFTYPTPQQLADHLWSRLEPDRPESVPAWADTAGPVPADSSDDDLYALIDGGYV
ncbi:type I polyketide synthase [Streptomyces sp. N35]|uniref:type I polyketide synthase n=1 Tax=Streptomyces sp. N35 TaxID=2795730 RepID=UPI0018F50A73|nr:type I polyketide synthase [Streptomyces sp. N35]